MANAIDAAEGRPRPTAGQWTRPLVPALAGERPKKRARALAAPQIFSANREGRVDIYTH